MPGPSPRRRSAVSLIGRTLALSLVAGGVVACGPGTSEITVSDAIVPVPATVDTAAVYLRITNDGDRDDRLLTVSTPQASLTHLHETSIDADGRAGMAAVGTLAIPAGETVDLSPGGLHLMMMQPDELVDGETVDLTLTFEHAGTKTVTARVTDDLDDVVGG